jgi:hypothetical protein
MPQPTAKPCTLSHWFRMYKYVLRLTHIYIHIFKLLEKFRDADAMAVVLYILNLDVQAH